MVEHVDGLSMEVELIVLHDFEVLVEACIEVLDARCRPLEDAIGSVAQEQPLTGSGEGCGNPVFKSVACPDKFTGSSQVTPSSLPPDIETLLRLCSSAPPPT